MSKTQSLRHHVLQYFLQIDYETVSQPYHAFRLELKPSELPLYWQLVQPLDAETCKLEQIHAVAPHSQAKETYRDLCKTYKYVTDLGQTYGVSPYLFGVAETSEQYQQNVVDTICLMLAPNNRTTYLLNWLDTPEGREALLHDMEREDIGLSYDEMDEIFDDEDEETLCGLKMEYINRVYYSWEDKRQKTFLEQRIKEFVMAAKPLTQGELNAQAAAYYACDYKDEIEQLQQNLELFRNSIPLTLNITGLEILRG